jgi:hypothetical protein
VVAVTTVQPSESYPWLGNPNHGGVGLTSEPGVGSSGVDVVPRVPWGYDEEGEWRSGETLSLGCRRN